MRGRWGHHRVLHSLHLASLIACGSCSGGIPRGYSASHLKGRQLLLLLRTLTSCILLVRSYQILQGSSRLTRRYRGSAAEGGERKPHCLGRLKPEEQPLTSFAREGLEESMDCGNRAGALAPGSRTSMRRMYTPPSR